MSSDHAPTAGEATTPQVDSVGLVGCAVTLGCFGVALGLPLALFAGWPMLPTVLWTAIPSMILGLYLGAKNQKGLLQQEEEWNRAERKADEELAGLSADELRSRAEQLLNNADRYSAQRCNSLPHLPFNPVGTLRTFLSTYSFVKEVGGVLVLDLTKVAPWENDPKFFILGDAEEHTFVACQSDEETIFIVAEDVPSEEAVEESHLSLYHYLLRREIRNAAPTITAESRTD